MNLKCSSQAIAKFWHIWPSTKNFTYPYFNINLTITLKLYINIYIYYKLNTTFFVDYHLIWIKKRKKYKYSFKKIRWKLEIPSNLRSQVPLSVCFFDDSKILIIPYPKCLVLQLLNLEEQKCKLITL